MCAFLLQNSALWGSKQIHCVICEMGLLAPLIKAAMCKSLQCNGVMICLPAALTISVHIVRLFLAFVIFSRVPQFSQSISLENLSFYPIRITRYLNRACMTTALRNNDVIMSAMASQITDVTIVCSTVCPGAAQRKNQSSASLALVKGIHQRPVVSLTKDQWRGKCFNLMTSSKDDVIKFDDVGTKPNVHQGIGMHISPTNAGCPLDLTTVIHNVKSIITLIWNPVMETFISPYSVILPCKLIPD